MERRESGVIHGMRQEKQPPQNIRQKKSRLVNRQRVEKRER
jgi:hypothetical protein